MFKKFLIALTIFTCTFAHARLSEGEAAIVGAGVYRLFTQVTKTPEPAVIYAPGVPIGIPVPVQVNRQPPSYGPYVDYCGAYVNDSVALAYCKGRVDRMLEIQRAAEADAYQRGRNGQ